MEIKMFITDRVRNVGDMENLLRQAGLPMSDHYVVKVNWFFQGKGFYTDVKTLELLLKCLNKVTVVEAYTFARNDGTRKITPINAKDNWDWIREQDKRFISEYGFKTLFKEYDVEYVNVTEVVWSDRIANAEDVMKLVEKKYLPVRRKTLYGYIPQRIYELRGRKLISFAKLKQTSLKKNRISATLKNIFGLIVDPNRERWHGEKDRELAQSIVDINKVYSTIFETVGMCEMIHTTVQFTKDGMYPLPWSDSDRYNLIENLGRAVCGSSLVAVDAYVSELFGIDPKTIRHLILAAKVFGNWPQEIISAAKTERSGMNAIQSV
jgi:hypothetical protein